MIDVNDLAQIRQTGRTAIYLIRAWLAGWWLAPRQENSNGLAEIALNQGRADRSFLNSRTGSPIEIVE
jgi:hypothetical protein